jgi:hypothetical protein
MSENSASLPTTSGRTTNAWVHVGVFFSIAKRRMGERMQAPPQTLFGQDTDYAMPAWVPACLDACLLAKIDKKEQDQTKEAQPQPQQ